jgi:hypothetical protein
MALATRSSWKIQPPPSIRQYFEFPMEFSKVDGEQIKLGYIPKDADDKWFIFFEDDWLYFHRSLTGICIYGVQLSSLSSGVRITSAWATRDREVYNSPGLEADIRTVHRLIHTILLARCLRY